MHPNVARTFAVVVIVCVALFLLVSYQLEEKPVNAGRRPLSIKQDPLQSRIRTGSRIGDESLNLNHVGVTVQSRDPYVKQVQPDGSEAKNIVEENNEKPSIKDGSDSTDTESKSGRMPHVLHEDMVDYVPEMLKKLNVFPKPAPQLYLPIDNNNIPADTDLKENLVTPVVFFVWCGKRWFEFKHYLSVVSSIKAMRPDKVLFYYEFYPVLDNNLYNLWIDDLKHDFEFFEMLLMEKNYAARICRGDRDLRLKELGYLVGYHGGMYVSTNTWINDLPVDRRLVDLDQALDGDFNGYLILRGGIITKEFSLVDMLNMQGTNTTSRQYQVLKSSCSAVHHLYQGIKSDCVSVTGKDYDTLYPLDLCYKENDPFAALVRNIFYGNEKIRKPTPSYDTLVPNIGHMIWVGGGPMDFMFYLSLLSMLFVVKVDVVYIHGDAPPVGPYWAKLNTIPRIRDRIKLINRQQPTMVYQGKIEYYYRALMSDIIRVDLMIKYGGIYTDTDAIWVRGLSDEDRGYDAVATYDWVDWSYPFPDTVNFGISYGKRNAPFYRLFRESMRVLHNDLHGYTGVAYPYKILEKHPDLLRIDRRLGVICYYSRCHPLWVKDYHNQTHDHIVANSIPNWREDVHAFHWTHPNPTELHNETILMQSTGMFAEIGKFVLEKAGLL